MVNKWDNDQSTVGRMYRLLSGMKLPKMQRIVAAASACDVRGKVFGLSMGRSREPYFVQAPSKGVELIKLVREQLSLLDPSFHFASLQVIQSGQAGLHCDRHNSRHQ